MATDANIPGEATAKVPYNFELLKNILVQGATTSSGHGHKYRSEQLREIYRFQRVNSMFRDVIGRSKTLRVMMFRTEFYAKEAGSDKAGNLQLINPLVSCLDLLCVPLDPSTFDDLKLDKHERKVLPGAIYVNFRQWFASAVAEFQRNSEGSAWRQMLLVSEPSSFRVGLKVFFPGESRPYECWCEMVKGDTLGDFADAVLRAASICKRGRKKIFYGKLFNGR